LADKLKLHTVYVVMLIWTPSFVSIIPPSNGAVRSMSTCMPFWKVQEFKSRLSFPAFVSFSICNSDVVASLLYYWTAYW